jgi:hypothetical protein
MWNIGSAVTVTSDERSPNAEVTATAFARRFSCVIMAPFGRPVVPDVYMITATS